MLRRLILGLALAVLATSARAEAPISSPLPPKRPVAATADAVTAVPGTRHILRPLQRPGAVRLSADALPDGPVRSPHPKLRPLAALRPEVVLQVAAYLHMLPETATVAPPERPENLQRPSQAMTVASRMPMTPRPPATDRRGSVCGVTSIKGENLAPIAARVRGCGLEEGVKVTAVGGVQLSTPATIDCPTAKALDIWVDQALVPKVGRLGGGVGRLDIMGSYDCRPRNNQRGAKVSEHGRGKAVDIGGFTLMNGTSITVLKGWNSTQHGTMLRWLHKAACGPFRTVLGPAANSFHRNHFHFDTARYRSGAYCE